MPPSMIIMTMPPSAAMPSPMIILVIIMSVSSMTSNLMKLYSVVRVFFFAIKPNIREIVPYREECCIHEIWEKELIEHEDDSERYNKILCSHNISIKMRWNNVFSIKKRPLKKSKDGSYLKNICLLNHIYDNCRKREKKCKWRQKVDHRIECRMCWLRYNKSPMKWKENCKNKDEIDCYTDNNHRESKWKKSTLTPKCLVPKEQYWE